MGTLSGVEVVPPIREGLVHREANVKLNTNV